MGLAVLLDLAFTAVERGIALIMSLQAVNNQTRELTPEQLATFEARKAAFWTSPAMETDAERAARLGGR